LVLFFWQIHQQYKLTGNVLPVDALLFCCPNNGVKSTTNFF